MMKPKRRLMSWMVKDEKFFAQHLKFGITLEIRKEFLNYHLKTPDSLERSARATEKAKLFHALQ